MKIVIAASSGISLPNFRGSLIREWVKMGHQVICMSIEPAEEMEQCISELGGCYYQIHGSRTGIGIGEGIKMILEYYKAFKKLRPDCCFFYMSKPVAFGGPAAALCRIRHINLLINGLENAYYRTSLKDYLVRVIMSSSYRFSSLFSDNVFIQNRDDYDFFLQHRLVKKEKLHQINGSGVDMSHFVRTPMPEEPVVMMASRLLWSKGIREYMKSIAIVREKHPNIKVMLVGNLDCNDEAITEDELNGFISEYNVEYCGYAKDIRPYLSECSIFVLPSYHEGTPRVVLEAMATGRPIITTLAPGCRETVEEGVNGYLVPVKDYMILADRIARLVEDKEMRSKMAEESYRICLTKYDANLVNKEVNSYMFGN